MYILTTLECILRCPNPKFCAGATALLKTVLEGLCLCCIVAAAARLKPDALMEEGKRRKAEENSLMAFL
jgi:hypothetical protein